jgi:hypothetical protein
LATLTAAMHTVATRTVVTAAVHGRITLTLTPTLTLTLTQVEGAGCTRLGDDHGGRWQV